MHILALWVGMLGLIGSIWFVGSAPPESLPLAVFAMMGWAVCLFAAFGWTLLERGHHEMENDISHLKDLLGMRRSSRTGSGG